MKRIVCLAVILSIVCLIIAGCAPSETTTSGFTNTTSTAKTIKIGGLFALSGFFSSFDTVQAQEAQIAADLINNAGGIQLAGQQYQIQLIIQDFQSTTDGVSAGTNKLVLEDGIKYIIAPSAFFSSPTSSVCEQNKVIRGCTFITCMPEEFGPGMDYSFLCHNSTMEHGELCLAYLQKHYPDVKTLAYVYPDEYTKDIVFTKQKQLIQQHGYTVSGDMINFTNENNDFDQTARRILELKTDAVFLSNGTYVHAGSLLKSLRQLNSNILLIYSGDAAPSDIIAVAGENASNNFFCTGIFNGAPNTPPLMQELIDTIYARYGQRSIHGQAPNVLYMFKQAIEKAGTLDTTSVARTWAGMETMLTPYGTAKLGGLKTYGIRQAYSHPGEIWTLQNGKPVFGDWIDRSPMP